MKAKAKVNMKKYQKTYFLELNSIILLNIYIYEFYTMGCEASEKTILEIQIESLFILNQVKNTQSGYY